MLASCKGEGARTCHEVSVGWRSCSACREDEALGRAPEPGSRWDEDKGVFCGGFLIFKLGKPFSKDSMVSNLGRDLVTVERVRVALFFESSITLMGGGRFFLVGVGAGPSESLEDSANLSWRCPWIFFIDLDSFSIDETLSSVVELFFLDVSVDFFKLTWLPALAPPVPRELLL